MRVDGEHDWARALPRDVGVYGEKRRALLLLSSRMPEAWFSGNGDYERALNYFADENLAVLSVYEEF